MARIKIGIGLILFAIIGFFGLLSPEDQAIDPIGAMIAMITLFGLPGLLLVITGIRLRISKEIVPEGQVILIIAFSIAITSFLLAIHMLTLSQPMVPKETPLQLGTMEECFNGKELVRNGLIAIQPKPIDFKVVFKKEIISLENNWYGEDAIIEIEGNDVIIKGRPDDVEKSWGDTIVSPGSKVPSGDPEPGLTAKLKLNPTDLHKALKLRVQMNVHYPSHQGSGFVNAGEILAKEFQLFVVSPEEMTLSKKIHNYQDRNYTAGGYGFIGLCGLIVIGVVYYKRRKGWYRGVFH